MGSRVSRIDIALDIDEIAFSRQDEAGFVTCARHRGLFQADAVYNHGKVFSGYVFGKGQPLLCRIYNKSLESSKTAKEWFLQLWRDNGWSGATQVWRVEFQVRREFLKERGLSSVEDTFRHIPSLWQYFTREWLSLRIPQKGVVCSRWPQRKEWQAVKEAGLSQAPSPLVRVAVKQAGTERLLDQVGGLLVSIGATTDTLDLEMCLLTVQSHCETKARRNATVFSEEVLKRKLQYL